MAPQPLMRPATAADPAECAAFLEAHPDIEAVDIVLSDLHGISRGKIIRRHELEALFKTGRPLPTTIFAEDVEGADIEGAMATIDPGGGDARCWPLPGTLKGQPNTGRGVVLLQMVDAKGVPVPQDPRQALLAQIAQAEEQGWTPKGALELEFYLLDPKRDAMGHGVPGRTPLGGRAMGVNNCMSVDELDELSPLMEEVYSSAKALDIPLESLLSEYAEAQFEVTLRYRDLARACDDLILTKRLIRTTARRHGLEACFMAKPFSDKAGCGMHLHLSLADQTGANLFADGADGSLSPLMLHAIGGARATLGDGMLVLAPVLNSWRRFASAVYAPATNTWGVEDRTVALRVPGTPGKGRHFEHRVAGTDANPYLVAALVLGSALDGIAAKTDPGPEGPDDARPLPRSWLDAIDAFEASATMGRLLSEPLQTALSAIKRHEFARLETHVTAIEWDLYGSTL